MGVFQNIAALAGNSTQIRPVDILSAGQQGMQQVQAGLQGITGQMAENRKLDAQQRADTAVSNLLKEAPKGTTDPTQFNQALGLASAYGSQGIKDVAKNAIQSATEGYRTALQQENFGKEFGLKTNMFEEQKRHASVSENQAQQSINNLKTYQDEKLALDKLQLEYQDKWNKASNNVERAKIGVSLKGIGIQQQNLNFNQARSIAELKSLGYEQDKKGNFNLNTNSPEYIKSFDSRTTDSLLKSVPSYSGFKELADSSDFFGGYVTPNSYNQKAYQDALTYITNPTADMNVIKNKMRVADYLKSGNYDAINGLNLLLPSKSK